MADHDGVRHHFGAVGWQARLAEATDYKYINFGIWAGLGEAGKDGTHGPLPISASVSFRASAIG